MINYPIVQYPSYIREKLDEHQQKHSSDDPVLDVFVDKTEMYVAAKPPKLSRFQQYFWYGMGGYLAVALVGISLNILPFLAAVLWLFAGVGLIARYAWILDGYRNQRLAYTKALVSAQSGQRKVKSIGRKQLPKIDWSRVSGLPTVGTKESAAQKGVSETYFLRYLRKYFGDAVGYGHEYLPHDYNFPYSADYELIVVNGVYFIIEVDEPYSGKSREPHHCTDNSKDINRDRYFLELGWVIIRFSEKQVVLTPDGCCGAIAAVILELTQDLQWLELSNRAQEVVPDPCWDSRQSKKYEAQKYREDYLARKGLYGSGGSKKPGRRK
jgi:hypothetical protein